jgi:hypothetical protein
MANPNQPGQGGQQDQNPSQGGGQQGGGGLLYLNATRLIILLCRGWRHIRLLEGLLAFPRHRLWLVAT